MIALHTAVPGALADLLKRTPHSAAKIQFAWRAAVGPSLARASTVQLAAAGVLNVEVPNVNWRREPERSRRLILERLELLLGAGAVTRPAAVKKRPLHLGPGRPETAARGNKMGKTCGCLQSDKGGQRKAGKKVGGRHTDLSGRRRQLTLGPPDIRSLPKQIGR